MSDQLKQVANGCDVRVKSFAGYDVNGYRFHTTGYEQIRPKRKTTNSGVCTPNMDSLTIMVELRKSLSSRFMETNLLNLSCSNVTGSILDQQDEPLILG